jgi:prepilin-type N-terminal cleavage/methylation domain-containing protein
MVTGTRDHRRAFTLLELLMVVSIIAVLSAMLLAVVGPIRRAVDKAKTAAILADVRLALNTVAADGNQISPVEHPLAGSAVPRSMFIRSVAPIGSAVDAASEALVVAVPATIIGATDQARIMLPSDIYVGGASAGSCDSPFLYGMQRGRIGVLGATSDLITTFRRIPALNSGYDAAPGVLRTPYDWSKYPNEKFLFKPAIVAPATLESQSAKVMDYILGLHRSGLLQKGAIFTAGSDGVLIKNGRVWQPQPPVAPVTLSPGVVKKDYLTTATWRAGTVNDGVWKRYRLRGTAIYDAWGREVLCSIGANDAIRLESAGYDGVFKWNPGADTIYQTNPLDTTSSGDDRDGSTDNVTAATRD